MAFFADMLEAFKIWFKKKQRETSISHSGHGVTPEACQALCASCELTLMLLRFSLDFATLDWLCCNDAHMCMSSLLCLDRHIRCWYFCSTYLSKKIAKHKIFLVRIHRHTSHYCFAFISEPCAASRHSVSYKNWWIHLRTLKTNK